MKQKKKFEIESLKPGNICKIKNIDNKQEKMIKYFYPLSVHTKNNKTTVKF